MRSEGRIVIGARLAERLQVSPPTVTATLRRMRRDDLVAASSTEGIVLTEKGTKLAADFGEIRPRARAKVATRPEQSGRLIGAERRRA